MIENIKKELDVYAVKEDILKSKHFHKTGKGEYAENDIFLAISVPNIRKIAKKYFSLITLEEVKSLLSSAYHEYRLTALIILTYKMQKAKPEEQENIFQFYLDNICYINGWDLVDLTCYHIVGVYILNNYNKINILYELANSDDLWSQRIAIVSTYVFIKNNKFNDTLKIAEILINNKHDLIHKAVGWMLREVGKKDFDTEYNFLINYYQIMPRTMLRYSIEKFPEDLRQKFLNNKFE